MTPCYPNTTRPPNAPRPASHSTRHAPRGRSCGGRVLQRYSGYGPCAKACRSCRAWGVWFESGTIRLHMGVETPFTPPAKLILHLRWRILTMSPPSFTPQGLSPAKIRTCLASAASISMIPLATGLNCWSGFSAFQNPGQAAIPCGGGSDCLTAGLEVERRE